MEIKRTPVQDRFKNKVAIVTGGSSGIPVFVRMLCDKFGSDKVRAMDQFTSVVGGLSVAAYEKHKNTK